MIGTVRASMVVPVSKSATNWLPANASAASQWTYITYGNGVFVAGSPVGTKIMSSSNGGETWTNRGVPGAFGVTTGLAYGNGTFVAVAQTGTQRIAYSTNNGANWTGISGFSSNAWSSVTYNEAVGVFVAVGSSGSNYIITSPNGITWTHRTTPAIPSTTTWFSSIAAGGAIVNLGRENVAVSRAGTGNRSLVSTATFSGWNTSQIGNSTQNAYDWTGVAYGDGVFVSVNSTNGAWVAYSGHPNSGVGWSLTTNGVSGGSWRGIAYGGGLFVAVGDGSPRIMTARYTDIPVNVDWVAHTAPQNNTWQDVAYGEGRFVAVSSDGTSRVMYSDY